MENEEAANRYEIGRDMGKIVFDQMTAQGVNPGIATIIGFEVAALGLENPGVPAEMGARVGALCMFAHRVIDGKFPDPRAHAIAACPTCMKIGMIQA